MCIEIQISFVFFWEIWVWHLQGFFCFSCLPLSWPANFFWLSWAFIMSPIDCYPFLYLQNVKDESCSMMTLALDMVKSASDSRYISSVISHQIRVVVASVTHKGANCFCCCCCFLDCYSAFIRSFLGYHSASLNVLFLLLFHFRPCDHQVPSSLIMHNVGTWQQVAIVLLIMSPGLGILL